MRIRHLLTAGLVVAAAGFVAAPAAAQATRTWVSGVGDDVNPCSRTAPCKTFAGAISKTAAGGEINCLDPGGYGAVTITKSLTIDCEGTFGSAMASGTTGFIINGADIVVTLRHLSVNGGGSPSMAGVNGIRFLQGAVLNVERLRLSNFSAGGPNGNGILIAPAAGTVIVNISGSSLIGNGTGTTGAGIAVAPTAAAVVKLNIRGTELTGNPTGIKIDTTGSTGAGASVVIADSLIGGGENGLVVSAGAAPADVTLSGSTVAHNRGAGILASGVGASVWIADSVVTDNKLGLSSAAGASVNSYGDNRLHRNGANGAFTRKAPVQ
jgi:hypothetical protein